MKTLLLIILVALLALLVRAEPINTACNLPAIHAGVLKVGAYETSPDSIFWTGEPHTWYERALSSDEVAAWFAVPIAASDADYYAIRDNSRLLFRVIGLYDEGGANAILWIIRHIDTGQWYAILADTSVLGDDGYPHPCAWGAVTQDDVYAIAEG